ncbi:MAG: hypothetical protein ABJC04_00430 [Verrucomicrobiota bacterium]
MNETEIENLLRKSPRLQVPDGLAETLREKIRLSREPFVRGAESGIWLRLKRWLPITICLVIGLTAIAMQFKIRFRLKEENASLRTATQNLEQLRSENAEYKKLQFVGEDLERLRKDNAELLRLRVEAAQLRTDTAGLEKMRAENKTLEASTIASAKATNDFFGEARARAERIQCVNNMKQIGLAARIWAGDNNDVYPVNFISMTNELGTAKILQCPSDKSREGITWVDVRAGNVSYKFYVGVSETEPNAVLAECPIHHNFCLADGSVQQLTEERMKKSIQIVNGKKMLFETR